MAERAAGTARWRRRGRPLRERRWWPTAAFVGVLLAVGAARAATVEYLYVEANEGGSSGGHVAIAFGEEVYHFQHHDGGFLELRKDDAPDFILRYALLDNRPIHVSRLALDDDGAMRLRDAFARRLQIESAHFARLTALRADVAAFESWQRAGRLSLPVRAAAYFAAPVAPDSSEHGVRPADGESSALADLRARVAARYGRDFIARRRAALHTELARFAPRAQRGPSRPLSLTAFPLFEPTAAVRAAELVEGLTALDILSAASPLRDDAWRESDLIPPLDDSERRALAGWAGRLRDDLVTLVASSRSDWGYPFLLGMARLAALERSAAGGRLVVLDTFADGAPRAALPDAQWRDAYFAALIEQNSTAVARARAELATLPRLNEADYSALEATLNELIEVEQAAAGAPLRMTAENPLPARAGQRQVTIAAATPAEMAGELDAARTAERAYAEQLTALYGYNLITRNCVSEIFAQIDAVRADADAADSRAATATAPTPLAGVIRTRGTLNFIPFVAAAAVDTRYPLVSRGVESSYRQRRLAALSARPTSWRTWLRESNTLTSTIYRPTPRDSTFLFFTDGAVAPRPLFGVANLLVGIGQSALGLASWPLDRGRRLQSGLNGALYSLPELAFFNIRKGTTAFVTSDELREITASKD